MISHIKRYDCEIQKIVNAVNSRGLIRKNYLMYFYQQMIHYNLISRHKINKKEDELLW
jgi:hypothetical protein